MNLDRLIKTIGILLICFSIVGFTACAITGCRTSQQQVVYNTIFSLEKGVTASYDGYLDLVVAGKVGTNDIARVAKSYDTFQASMRVATDAVQYNTNALAPASLVVEGQDVINLIAQIKKVTK